MHMAQMTLYEMQSNMLCSCCLMSAALSSLWVLAHLCGYIIHYKYQKNNNITQFGRNIQIYIELPVPRHLDHGLIFMTPFRGS